MVNAPAILQNQMHPGLEAGTDEAGRGCLCGPVTAATVILPPDFYSNELNDSKLLTKTQRNRLQKIIEKEALAFAVAHVLPDEIDRINILNATIKAMHHALASLKRIPSHILVDGNRFKNFGEIPHQCVIKGDQKFKNIAAASILAKIYRDAYMDDLHCQYPQYGWDSNKGYPTKKHREAIQRYGPTRHHRKSFRLLPDRLPSSLIKSKI